MDVVLASVPVKRDRQIADQMLQSERSMESLQQVLCNHIVITLIKGPSNLIHQTSLAHK